VSLRVKSLVDEGASLDETQTKIYVLPEEVLMLGRDRNEGHTLSLR
jgi:hypothetical protein